MRDSVNNQPQSAESMRAIHAFTRTFALGVLLMTPRRSSAQSDTDIDKQFVGMWRLVSQPQRPADGTTRQDPKSVAYITYTDTGHMCYVAMYPTRPPWKSAATPTPAEALSGLAGFGAYCGSVEIHAKEGYVIHHVEIAMTPANVGRIFKRWYTFQGPNRVSLRVDAPSPRCFPPHNDLCCCRVA